MGGPGSGRRKGGGRKTKTNKNKRLEELANKIVKKNNIINGMYTVSKRENAKRALDKLNKEYNKIKKE